MVGATVVVDVSMVVVVMVVGTVVLVVVVDVVVDAFTMSDPNERTLGTKYFVRVR